MRAFILVWLMLVPVARASADESDRAKADVLFREAKDLMSRGDLAQACPKLAESARLDRATGTLVNLANCEEQRGHARVALDAWQQALGQMKPADKRKPLAEERIAALGKRVAWLTITLPSDAPADTAVRRDDALVRVEERGVAVPIDPGTHVISMSAGGRAPQQVTVTVGEGEKRTVALSAASRPPASGALATPRLLPAPPALQAQSSDRLMLHQEAQPEDRPIWKKWPFWAAVGGAAIAGTVVAIAVSGGGGSDLPTINYR